MEWGRKMICKVADLAKAFPGKDFSQFDNLIPQELRWHLLLDKKAQSRNDPLYFDHSTVNTAPGKAEEEDTSNRYRPPEARAQDNGSEPGYYQSMMEAFKYVLQNVHTPLSCDFLLESHNRATGQLTGGQWTQIGKPYGFVGAGILCLNQNSTEKSRQPTPDAKVEWENERLIYDLSDRRNLNPWAAGYLACYNPAEHRFKFEYKDNGWYDLGTKVPACHAGMDRFDWADHDKREQIRNFLKNKALPPMPLFNDFNFREWLKPKFKADRNITYYAKEYLWRNLQQTNYNVLVSRLGVPTIPKPGFHDWNKPYTEKVLNYYIKAYETSLAQARDDNDKLLAIVRIIRAFEIAHPFADCNQRVFVFLLLNKLLLQNGFLPVILEDPWVFNGYMSAAELVGELKIGFKNFRQTVITDNYLDTRLPRTKLTDETQLTKLQGGINAAVVQYIHWFGADNAKGWFHRHGDDGQRRAREFLRQASMKKTSEDIWNLIKELANNKIIRDERYIPIGGTVQAHPHSFISFLLNELRTEPELRTHAKIQDPMWNQITAPNFDFTKNDSLTNSMRVLILANLKRYIPYRTDIHD